MNIGKESENVEFKQTTGELKSSMDDVASILNKSGSGTLYFGIKPNGDVVGQTISASTLNDVATFFKTAIKPMVYPTISEKIIDDKHIIKVEFSGSEKPYSSYGRYYKRVHDRAEEMTPDELKHMMLDTDYSSYWENRLTSYGIDAIDKKSLLRFYSKAIACGRLIPLDNYDEQELLISLGLMKDDKLTNAGYYLFSKKEPTIVKMAVYATDARINFLDIERARGNIFDLIDTAINYINEHINWRVEFSPNSSSRVEVPEIPTEAIREIVVNAFAHANYRGITEHEIDITPTVIDIYNPGEFPSNYKPEDFAERRIQSMPRNKKILDVLYRSKNVEIQGSGIRRVLQLCKENNVKYSYFNNDHGFRFTFYRKKDAQEQTLSSKTRLSKTDEVVLDAIKVSPFATTEDMAHSINKSVRTVQRSLEKLKEANLIRRSGTARNSGWIIL